MKMIQYGAIEHDLIFNFFLCVINLFKIDKIVKSLSKIYKKVKAFESLSTNAQLTSFIKMSFAEDPCFF